MSRRGPRVRFKSLTGICSFPDCGRAHKCKGYCHVHSVQLRNGQELKKIGLARWKKESMYTGTACLVADCPEVPTARSCCASHYFLTYRFGMSPAGFSEALAAQGGGCAICFSASGGPMGKGRPTSRLAVDHDHRTGAIRGLLCGSCNLGLGSLGDDPSRLRRAAEYLESARNLGLIKPQSKPKLRKVS